MPPICDLVAIALTIIGEVLKPGVAPSLFYRALLEAGWRRWQFCFKCPCAQDPSFQSSKTCFELPRSEGHPHEAPLDLLRKTSTECHDIAQLQASKSLHCEGDKSGIADESAFGVFQSRHQLSSGASQDMFCRQLLTWKIAQSGRTDLRSGRRLEGRVLVDFFGHPQC